MNKTLTKKLSTLTIITLSVLSLNAQAAIFITPKAPSINAAAYIIFCGKRIKANLVLLLMSESISKPLLRQCLAFFRGLELARLACFRCLLFSEIGRAISP
jgi:hypothetical protein